MQRRLVAEGSQQRAEERADDGLLEKRRHEGERDGRCKDCRQVGPDGVENVGGERLSPLKATAKTSFGMNLKVLLSSALTILTKITFFVFPEHWQVDHGIQPIRQFRLNVLGQEKCLSCILLHAWKYQPESTEDVGRLDHESLHCFNRALCPTQGINE